MRRDVETHFFTCGVRRLVRGLRSGATGIGGCGRRRAGWLSSCAALLVLVAGLVAFAPLAAWAQSEDQIKAAFLFNFARYVEWPEDAFDGPEAPVKICMMSSVEFSDVVSKTVSGKTVSERPVEVASPGELGGATHCHILFVDESQPLTSAQVVQALDDASVFTVSDRGGFAQAGGVANFILVDNKIRFEINPRAARNVGLKVSSQLLRLAKVVE